MKYRKQSHCVYYCEYHLVFATKYRRKIFNDGIFEYMRDRLKEVKDHYPEIDIVEINHDKDHIHLLVIIPPKYSVSQVVRILKSKHKSRFEKEVSIFKESVLGDGRDLVRWILCLDGWSQ